MWDSRSIRLKYQDKIYKLCQEVRNALDLFAKHLSYKCSHLLWLFCISAHLLLTILIKMTILLTISINMANWSPSYLQLFHLFQWTVMIYLCLKSNKMQSDPIVRSANRIKHGFQKVLEKGKTDTNGVITWGGFNSQHMWICQTSIVIIYAKSSNDNIQKR